MLTKKCTGLNGENRDYYLYPEAIPPYEASDYIQDVLFDAYRYHSGEGDMWPITWAQDDNLYCGAGDNKGCPMNLWRVSTLRFAPSAVELSRGWIWRLFFENPGVLSFCLLALALCGSYLLS